jgi:hypothetical protein
MDPADSLFYLTLTRSFSGKGNAYDLAQNPDLVFYPGADIRLEGWSGPYKTGEIRFRPTGQTKKPRLFPEVPGYCFEAVNEGWRMDENSGNQGVTNFRLVVDLKGRFGPVVSTLPVLPYPKMDKPSKYDNLVDLYPPDSSIYMVSFKIDLKLVQYCELLLTFRYQELTGGVWLDRGFTTPLKKSIMMVIGEDGKKTATTLLYPQQFYNRIAVNIKPVNDTILRRFRSLDLTFIAGDRNYKDYSETYINTGNFDGLPEGNIINGFGLFTMIRSVKMKNLGLSLKTLDSLCNGQYTRQLGFITW